MADAKRMGLSSRKTKRNARYLMGPELKRVMSASKVPPVSQLDVVRSIRKAVGQAMFIADEEVTDEKYKYEGGESWTVKDLDRLQEAVQFVYNVTGGAAKRLEQFVRDEKIATSPKAEINKSKKGFQAAMREFEALLPDNEIDLVVDPVEQQVDFMMIYNDGMRVLRKSWSHLFYITATQPKKVRLDKKDSDWVRASKRDDGKPPAPLVAIFSAEAEEIGRPIEVYSSDKELLHVQVPTSMMGDRPLARPASGKARQQWGFRKVDTSNSRVFKEQLTPEQKRVVSEYLKKHRGRPVPLDEIAAETGVEYVMGDTGVGPERIRGSEYVENSSNSDARSALDDYALFRRVWMLDLD
jgi:hypothetical protein